MTDKHGTPEQRRNVLFERTPATETSSCPFKGQEAAIVPVRYALDRSRYDAEPDKLKPLPKTGNWALLPELETRRYTLRQLYDGYVYVFDETDRTFHEYAVNAADASLTRIVWTDAHLGQDTRRGVGEAKPHLLYPRLNRLHLAFSPMQWTWRLCEHMRSNADSRATWMKPLDLAGYCITMAEPGTLPLRRIAEAVADIDPGNATPDSRFDDSSVPTSNTEAGVTQTDVSCKPLFSPVGADVYWLGSVPDKNSALLIALDDPLAMLNDLGLQLAADQAAYRVWQDEHGHKLEMAKVVTNLCASSDDPDGLPASVKGDVVRTQRYLQEVDEYLDQLELEEIVVTGGILHDSYVDREFAKSPEMKSALSEKYGTTPDRKDFEAWKPRAKWRREVDLKRARAYIATHQPTAEKLLQQIRDTQADFRMWADHIGLDPAVLFVDTTHVKSLLYLQTVMSELLTVYSQDIDAHGWLLEQEKHATSLFGTLRYGFSPAIKEALHQEADRLLKGMNDYTNLATRAGEINAALNHPDVAEAAWMKKLTQSARDTYSALRELASGKGRTVAESIVVALIPVDARYSKGKKKDILALFRSFMIGQVLLDSKHKVAIDAKVGAKLKTWKENYILLDHKITKLRNSWVHPRTTYDRKSLSHQISQVQDDIQKHMLQFPIAIDYQEQQSALALRNQMHAHIESGLKTLKHWEARAKEWIIHLGAGLATTVTWGVLMMNFINTALLYGELTRDGEFSERDMIKVGYGLGYSLNLLMSVFVETPWAVVKTAQPVIIEGKTVGILQRSSAYWIGRGDSAWGNAVHGFRVGIVAVGVAGVIAATLEVYDLYEDLKTARTTDESNGIRAKAIAVGAMQLGAIAQVIAGLSPSSSVAAAVLSSWFTAALAIAGIVYIIGTVVLNYIQQDSVGWWLRKSSWSISNEHRLQDTPAGHAEEIRTLLAIQNSPSIFVRSTCEDRLEWVGRSGYIPQTVLNGAWIQISLPSTARGETLRLTIISTERPYGVLVTEKSKTSIAQQFLNNGRFGSAEHFATIDERYGKNTEEMYFPKVPPSNKPILWQVWVPLPKTAAFIELMIQPPAGTLISDPGIREYLYQINLKPGGEMTSDGLIKTNLTVQTADPTETISLEIPFGSAGDQS
ncbi:hypothetical protein EGJ27_19305 [Pseudomonas sp. v388]|uniref:toxin VasX n=1 Tax=Pseudomonas sp. v388 TaxID=2479849 RepID=UPI000F7896D8|nr:toxin VasX [Pseudomonas sp. v388]RRV05314.1 hypothetical protein EGJ27_19305 [Pseudomonas sp. v388]